MSNQRGSHWKRRVLRQLIGLGTVSSLFSGVLLAAPPELPGLPGLPVAETSTTASNDRPQLLPVPTSQPGSSLRSGIASNTQTKTVETKQPNGTGTSGVNIKILPGLPPTGLTTPAAPETRVSAALGQDKGTVQVKMQDTAKNQYSNQAPSPLATSYVSSSPAVTPSTPITIANDKPHGAGPVKLSIGDSGIVDLGVQRPRQDTVVTSRAPELVKPKKYSVSQPVVLAQAAEIQALDSANNSLPVAQDTSEPQLIVPSLPIPSPLQAPTQDSKPAVLQPAGPHLEQLAGEPEKNTKPADISEPKIATPVPLLPPNSSRSAAVTVTNPTVPENPVTPTEATASHQNKVVASQNELALRQHALRNKPEKSYDIESRGTYSIDIPFLVAATSSLDSSVCTVFNNGNSITIAGGAAGNTRVAIASQTGETRVIEVNVLPVGQQFSRPQSEIDQVKELIGKVFPDARVQIVSLQTGEVEVKGTTPTESDARKILELVRKVCLVPVHDRLKSGR